MPKFTRTTSGNPAGRPRGTQNKVTVEARAIALRLVNDPAYRAKFLTDLRRRKVLPAVECMLWHYAYGKPKDTVTLETTVPPFHIIVEDARATLHEKLERLSTRLHGETPEP